MWLLDFSCHLQGEAAGLQEVIGCRAIRSKNSSHLTANVYFPNANNSLEGKDLHGKGGVVLGWGLEGAYEKLNGY